MAHSRLDLPLPVKLAPHSSVTIDLGNLLPGAKPGNDFLLLDKLITAHRDAAKNNDNLSKGICVQACYGSGKFRQGLVAAIASLGDVHAPLVAAREVWEQADTDVVTQNVANGAYVPGFGNAFYKDHVDPAFKDLHALISSHYPRIESRLADLTQAVWKGLAKRAGCRVKEIWPNAALYTAAVANQLQVPHGLEEILFLLPRIPVWGEACLTGPTTTSESTP